ncbi:MAG: hypothetical protein J5644_07115 [Bacteroidales bacterium]|nr:hypothetical protein [Bacteroidales bacterium]
MKTLKSIFSLVCAIVLLLAGQVYGQKKGSSVILPPQKGNNAYEQAVKLTGEGWKTAMYNIEEQLASTWKLMSEADGNVNRYIWAEYESAAESLEKAKMENYMQCIDILSYQVQLPFMSQCRLIMIQKNIGGEQQIAEMEKTVNYITPIVIQNNSLKSMEFYKEMDKNFIVQTVYLVDKTNIYDELLKECVKFVGNYKDAATYTEIFKEAHDRMAKQSLR